VRECSNASPRSAGRSRTATPGACREKKLDAEKDSRSPVVIDQERKPTVGFEPTTTGSQNRCHGELSPANTGTYDTSQGELTPQVTPEGPKRGEIGTQTLPPDLAQIVAAWPTLAGHIKAAIMALVKTV
jgi:hypothetical protein